MESLPAGVEVVRRHAAGGAEGADGGAGTFLFVLNHTAADVVVPGRGRDLLTGAAHDGEVAVPAYGVVVLREG